MKRDENGKVRSWLRSTTVGIAVKCAALFLILLLLYTGILLGITAIPNACVEANVTEGLALLEAEGTYPKPFFHTNASQLDNFTDRRMLGATFSRADRPAIESAMIIGGRVQYWQGYLLFLKPLLAVFSLVQLRYVMYVGFFLAFLLSVLSVVKHVDRRTAVAYALAIVLSNVLTAAVSLQYYSVYMLTFCAVLLLLRYSGVLLQRRDARAVFFLTLGSVTCFLDFLTFPLMTLGVPLILLLVCDRTGERAPLKRGFAVAVCCSVCFGFGYAATFAGKWCIASVLLGRNLVSVALEQLFVRVNGAVNALPVDRVNMLVRNIKNVFGLDLFRLRAVAAVAAVVIAVAAVCFSVSKRRPSWRRFLPLALVACYPYIWYLLFANHSAIHHWFTFRSQVSTAFAVLYFVLCCVCGDRHSGADEAPPGA